MARTEIIKKLQTDVLALQGFKRSSERLPFSTGLDLLERSFPEQVFPTGAVHEFISTKPENRASTSGFIVALSGRLLQQKAKCIWVSTKRVLFPSALKVFGINPDCIIFIDVYRHKDALWAIEEALKCDAVSVVVGEISELSFTESRRLQLAVEQSKVTGFIHRVQPRHINTVACMTRWRIEPIPSVWDDDMPGVGFPRWNVRLGKVRNGKPGAWQIEWSAGGFHIQKRHISIPAIQQNKIA